MENRSERNGEGVRRREREREREQDGNRQRQIREHRRFSPIGHLVTIYMYLGFFVAPH